MIAAIPLTPESLSHVWSQLTDQAGFAIKGDLRKVVEQAISGPNALVIRFPHGYNLPDGPKKTQIEELLGKITGQTWTVKPETLPASANGHPAATAAETPMQRKRRVQEEVLQQPLTARLKEVLGATVVDVEEGFGQAPAKKTAPVADDIDDGSPPVEEDL